MPVSQTKGRGRSPRDDPLLRTRWIEAHASRGYPSPPGHIKTCEAIARRNALELAAHIGKTVVYDHEWPVDDSCRYTPLDDYTNDDALIHVDLLPDTGRAGMLSAGHYTPLASEHDEYDDHAEDSKNHSKADPTDHVEGGTAGTSTSTSTSSSSTTGTRSTSSSRTPTLTELYHNALSQHDTDDVGDLTIDLPGEDDCVDPDLVYDDPHAATPTIDVTNSKRRRRRRRRRLRRPQEPPTDALTGGNKNTTIDTDDDDNDIDQDDVLTSRVYDTDSQDITSMHENVQDSNQSDISRGDAPRASNPTPSYAPGGTVL